MHIDGNSNLLSLKFFGFHKKFYPSPHSFHYYNPPHPIPSLSLSPWRFPLQSVADHTPYSAGERARVEANGGSVEHRGVLRVNGELAVTRTLGNRRLSRDGVLSSEPDVVFVSRRGVGDVHGNQSGETRGFQHGSGGVDGGNRAAFLVLASDGLWDVVSSQEAVDMVKEVIQGASPGYRPGVAMPKLVDIKAGDSSTRLSRNYGLYGPGQAFQVAATALTHEAYVRGSTDNIGVCVVDLRPH